MVGADKVQRYKGQPVDCVDTVSEENEPAITRSENSECTQMINFQYTVCTVYASTIQKQALVTVLQFLNFTYIAITEL